jgi:large conductance mechanosensitive channel
MKLWQEFKAFAFKGNMIDLAVAVVIGTAFGKVISSLVADVIMPAISYLIPSNAEYTKWTIGPEKGIAIGRFIGETISFLVIAAAVFLVIVKLLGLLMKKPVPPLPAAGPLTKECPMCLSVIPIKARKCAHCTTELAPA